jgi:Putative Flp pilus-assembly TadE/G-like
MGLPTQRQTFARRRAGSENQSADERGLVVVWLAIMLTVLLGVSALAIDVAYWQVTKNREQRAADAASLAGAVSFPGNGTAANASAADLAASNGYDAGSTVTPVPAGGTCTMPTGSDTTVCGGAGDQAYQYKVTVLKRVNNYFGNIFGIPSTVVRATAQAEYLKPLTMGSPSNQFGNDPDSVTSWPLNGVSPTYPNFWANIAGGNSPKPNGDAYAAGACDGATDGCSGSGANMNLDKKPGGYYYAVDFTSASTVNLQAFDPAFVAVGDTCGAGNLAGASALPSVPNYPQGDNPGNQPDWAKRYSAATNQADPGFQYCTGDVLFANPPPITTFTVLKASVPGDPNSAQPVSGCPPITYQGYSGPLAALLGSGGSTPGESAPLATYFRQWVDLCPGPIAGQAGDEYFIEVTTDANSSGHNRYAVRGVTTSGSAAPVSVAGNTYMGIYANVAAQLTRFYLARVPSAAAHHTLVLNFFDIGDATGQGTLTIVPPADATVNGTPLSAFSDCTWSGLNGSGAKGFDFSTPLSPWGPPGPISGCQITGVNDVHNNWNAQWSTVTIPIPAGYTCDDGDPNGCWVKIDYLFPTGGITDTTSWNAFLLGDPVRLVK